MTELMYKHEVYAIVGAAMEVYNVLGPGFLEAVYQEALELELMLRSVPFAAQQQLSIQYKHYQLQKTYAPDLLVYDSVIVEIKALNQLTTREEAQLLNYLKATGCAVGLLINFCASPRLEWKRMVYTQSR